MKTVIQVMGILAVVASGAASTACSPSIAAPEATSDPGAPTAPPRSAARGTQAMTSTTEAKISAPVEVTLTASASSGTVVITLSLRAEADIPRAVARIVLPGQVRLVRGQTQIDIPFLERGAVSQYQVTVEVPNTAQFRIFAGVDCHIGSGVLLHKGAQELILGS